MNTLCISTDLTSGELAAWVQAIGSVVAIFAAASIAIWQGRKQYRNALDLHMEEQRYTRIKLTKTLSVLAENAAKAMVYLTGQMNSRQAVHDIAGGIVHFDSGELSRIDAAIAGIPLHNLPHSLVTPTMLLSGTVRQFREKTEMAIRAHRKMDAAAFEDLFRTLGEMNESLEKTCGDIATELSCIQREG